MQNVLRNNSFIRVGQGNQPFFPISKCLVFASLLSACKKSNSSFTFFRYCKEIALVILGNVGMSDHTQCDGISLKKPLMFICRQKINFILKIFLKIVQKYCKLVILGMPDYAIQSVPTYRKCRCLSVCQKYFIIDFFLDILHFILS